MPASEGDAVSRRADGRPKPGLRSTYPDIDREPVPVVAIPSGGENAMDVFDANRSFGRHVLVAADVTGMRADTACNCPEAF
jgi:hypothetical protein